MASIDGPRPLWQPAISLLYSVLYCLYFVLAINSVCVCVWYHSASESDVHWFLQKRVHWSHISLAVAQSLLCVVLCLTSLQPVVSSYAESLSHSAAYYILRFWLSLLYRFKTQPKQIQKLSTDGHCRLQQFVFGYIVMQALVVAISSRLVYHAEIPRFDVLPNGPSKTQCWQMIVVSVC